MEWWAALICVVVIAVLFLLLDKLVERVMFLPHSYKYHLWRDGIPKAPWDFIEAVKQNKPVLIFISGKVGLKRVRDFMDGVAMTVAAEIGDDLCNRFNTLEGYTTDRVERECRIVLKGFRKEGETPTDAQFRITMEAEQRLNSIGDIRAHFS